MMRNSLVSPGEALKEETGEMPVCPHCCSRGMIKFGWYRELQKWHCMVCGLTTAYPRQRVPRGYDRMVLKEGQKSED